MVNRRSAEPTSTGSRKATYGRRKLDVRALNVYHRAVLASRDDALTALLVTPVGRWIHTGKLDVVEGKAALLIGEIYGRFDWTMGRQRSVRSPSWEAGRSGGSARDLNPDLVAEYRADFDTLQSKIPVQARGAIEALCVEGLCINSLYIDDIRAILRNVASAFGIGGESRTPAPGIVPARRVPVKDRPRQAKGRWDDGHASNASNRHSDTRAALDHSQLIERLQAKAQQEEHAE